MIGGSVVRVFRWALYVITILVAALLFFAPRPYFPPDWVTALDEAVAANDCNAVMKILTAAHVGFLPYHHYHTTRLANAEVCGLYPIKIDQDGNQTTPESRLAESRSRDEAINPEPSLWAGVQNTSWFSSAYSPTLHLVTNGFPAEWRLTADFYQAWPLCARLAHPLSGMRNYRPMYVALSNPDQPLEEFRALVDAENTYCARRLSALALRLEADYAEPFQKDLLTAMWFAVEYLNHSDKAVLHEMILWKERAKNAFDQCVADGSAECNSYTYTEPGRTCGSFQHPFNAETALLCAKFYLSGDAYMDPAQAYYYALFATEADPEATKVQQTIRRRLSIRCAELVKSARKLDGREPWNSDAETLGFFVVTMHRACQDLPASGESKPPDAME